MTFRPAFGPRLARIKDDALEAWIVAPGLKDQKTRTSRWDWVRLSIPNADPYMNVLAMLASDAVDIGHEVTQVVPRRAATDFEVDPGTPMLF